MGEKWLEIMVLISGELVVRNFLPIVILRIRRPPPYPAGFPFFPDSSNPMWVYHWDVYGVIIDPKTFEIDREASRNLRGRLLASRKT
jgi:hypothetical protein